MKTLVSSLFFALCFSCTTLFSQVTTWERQYSYGSYTSSRLYSLHTDNEAGDIVVAGRFDTLSSVFGVFDQKAITMLLDSSGNLKWIRTITGSDFMNASAGKGVVYAQDNSGIVVCGLSFKSTCLLCPRLNSLLLLKYSLSGDVLWKHEYYNDENHIPSAESIDNTVDGGYIISGIYDNCLFLMKTDINGDSLWTKKYSYFKVLPPDVLAPTSKIIQTSDQGYILCHTTANTTDTNGMEVIKFNADGDTMWSSRYYSNLSSTGNYIIELSDGNYLACGAQRILNNTTSDAMIVKITPLGEVIWKRLYDSFGYEDVFNTLKKISVDEYVAAGSASSTQISGEKDYAYVVKINALGDTIWTKTDNPEASSLSESISDMDITTEGGILMVGNIFRDMLLAKLDENGYGFTEIKEPNPMIDFNIKFYVQNNEVVVECRNPDFKLTKLSVSIMNDLGQTFYSGSINPNSHSRINISELRSGTYILRIFNQQSGRSFKFVKSL